MKIIFDLLALAFIIVFIVDLSGFKETLLAIVRKATGKAVLELKPFTCSLCLTWWTGFIVWFVYCCKNGGTNLWILAAVALISFLTPMINQLFVVAKELCETLFNLIYKLIDKIKK